MRGGFFRVLLFVFVACVGLGVTVSALGEARAWWHLQLGEIPARVQPGSARDEVQELAIHANGGLLILYDEQSEEGAAVPYNVEAKVLGEELERVAYGAGNVEVTGGPGSPSGGSPYFIRFVGALADQRVALIEAPGASPSGSPLVANPALLEEEAEGGGETVTGAKGVSVGERVAARGDGQLLVTATNEGEVDTSGSTAKGVATPTEVADVLPAGLRAIAVEAYEEKAAANGTREHEYLVCVVATVSCSFSGSVVPYRQIEMLVTVVAEPGWVSGEVNEASVSGGGAIGVTASRPVAIGGPVVFGIENYELALEEVGGSADTQAGSHPYQLTSTVTFNQSSEPGKPPALAKDVPVRLPAGLIGNPTPFPECTETQFLTSFNGVNECPEGTAVGVAYVRIYDPPDYGPEAVTLTVPIFNLRPEVGEPARFGIDVQNVPAFLDASVRTGSDYGVTVTASNIPETATFIGGTFTFWGVPKDPRHDNARGWSCVFDEHYRQIKESLPACAYPHEEGTPPLLSLPTSCTASLETTASADSWQEPGVYEKPGVFGPVQATVPLPALAGCNKLPVSPEIVVAPDGTAASTPTGLTVQVRVPQQVAVDPQAESTESNVEAIQVTLPTGVELSPGAADGLETCTTSEIGYTGENMLTHVQEFSPELPSCPAASKIATVSITTPLLRKPLAGAVYLASPQNYRSTGPLENPFHELLAMYIVARDPESGVLVKLPGQVTATEPNGQLVATFEHLPDVPFEEAEMHFFGAGRAPLSTPATCGTYTTTAVITPSSGNPPTTTTSSFNITTGPNNTGAAGCAAPRAFAPGFTAGSSNLQAGAFTPFTVTLTRPDEDQQLGGVELQMPPGFSGDLSHVKLCGEPEASQGTCGAESLIGETTVSAGLGGDPYTVTGGRVYITTAYGGGNFGLSIVNPAQAGPFVLQEGRPVIVRAGLFINKFTSDIRVVSGSLPTIIEGIPLQIQHVNVTLNRAGFAFNPTNCKPLEVSGTLTSNEGAAFGVSSPFQVTNCANLAFAPKLTASVQGKASKKDGASLHVKLTYPAGPQDANIAKVKVDLPIQLPTEQRTLTKACLAKVFEANPANCPKYSIVGHAKAVTPILPVPLEGPAYFVSYGNEKFPNLIIALHGYGITIDLVGTTFISKQGITSSTFNTVPDQPVGSFELTLPTGPYSALAANLPHNKQNFCGTKLTMPTAYQAQNGAEKHLNTPITITGCPKHKTHKNKTSKKK